MAWLDDLVSFWKLDEASGTRNDAHGSNHLTDNNTVGSAAGRIGTGADFESANSEYLSRASNATLQLGDIDWTITAWLKVETQAEQQIVAKDTDSPANSRDYTLDVGPAVSGAGRFIRGYFNGGGTSSTHVTSDVDPTAGTWYFVAFWHDAAANSLNIQVNGGTVFTVSTTGLAPQVSTGDFTIGARTYTGFEGYFDGVIDEVGLWKRVLTAQERADLYNLGVGITYEDMGGGSGTTENAVPVVLISSVVNPTTSLAQTFTPVATTATVVSPGQTVSSAPGVIQTTGAIDTGSTTLNATLDPIVTTGSVVTPTTGGEITESPSPIVVTGSVVTPDHVLGQTPSPIVATGSVVTPGTTLSNTPTPVVSTSAVAVPTTALAAAFTPVVVTGSVVTPTDSRSVSPSPVVGTATLVTFATTLLYSPTPIVATTNVVTPNTTVGNISPPGGFNVIAHVYTPGAVAAYVHVPNSQGWIHTAGGQGGIVP